MSDLVLPEYDQRCNALQFALDIAKMQGSHPDAGSVIQAADAVLAWLVAKPETA